MDFSTFAEGPLLWIVFILFLAGVSARIVFFGIKIVTSPKGEQSGWGFTMPIFGRFLLPFHKAIAKKPLYAVIRYVFHLSLFIVPIWLGAHVSLWEESSLGWSWSSIPDKLADWMTLLVIVTAAFFLAREAFLVRGQSGDLMEGLCRHSHRRASFSHRLVPHSWDSG